MDFGISKDEKVCINCKYYRGYYAVSDNEDSSVKSIITEDGKRLIQIYKGDCQNQNRKTKRNRCPFDEACYLFEEKL